MNVAELAKEYNNLLETISSLTRELDNIEDWYNGATTINGYELNDIISLLQNYKDRLDSLNIV